MATESSSLTGSKGSKPNNSHYDALSSHDDAPHSSPDEEQGRGNHSHPSSTHSHHGGHGHSHAAVAASVPPRMSPRSAFARRDAEASKRAHAAKREARLQRAGMDSPSSGHSSGAKEEGHNTETGEYIKSIVYGGLDGIITTFATVTSVAGADFSAAVIVVLGISHLFADGLSMGMGDYMSSQAEIDYTASERAREQWEMDENMKGEIDEMIDLYMEKGVSEVDARIIINTMAKYPETFLDHMMVEELGLLPPEADQGFSPAKAGVVTMCSFMLFGSIPLLSYLVALIPGVHISPMVQLWWAVSLTLLTLFLLGAFKGHVVEIGRSAWWKSGLLMAFNGSMAATIGYICGYLIGEWMELPPGAG